MDIYTFLNLGFNQELIPLSAAIFCISLKKRDTKGFPLLSGLGELFSEEDNPFEEEKGRLCALASLREPNTIRENPALCRFEKQVKPNKKGKSKLCVLVPLWQKARRTGKTSHNFKILQKTLHYKNRHTSNLEKRLKLYNKNPCKCK